MNARIGKPTELPVVDEVAKREWAAGWYSGMAVGLINGVALAVLAGWLR